MLRAKMFSRELRMTTTCRTGLSDGTITTPKAALLAMGSTILLSSKSVGPTRLEPWDVVLEEHRRQSKLLGHRSGSSMPMKATESSPDNAEVSPAILPSQSPECSPCVWSSQLLEVIGFDEQKRNAMVIIANYPSPDADAKHQLKDVSKAAVDPSLAAMMKPFVAANAVVSKAIQELTNGCVLDAPLGDSTLLDDGVLNGFIPEITPLFTDATMFTNAQRGALNVVPRPALAAGLGAYRPPAALGAQLRQLGRLSASPGSVAVLSFARVAPSDCSAPRCSQCGRLPLRPTTACRGPYWPGQLSASDRFVLRRAPTLRVRRPRVHA